MYSKFQKKKISKFLLITAYPQSQVLPPPLPPSKIHTNITVYACVRSLKGIMCMYSDGLQEKDTTETSDEQALEAGRMLLQK